MNIVFFCHPGFLYSQSMPRYANWLETGMKARGHSVQTWTSEPYFYKIPFPKKIRKWLAYIDQYIVFPLVVKKKIRKLPGDTLFVFCDHALGPWVPLVIKRPHIIHCHDFLAQKSALGQIAENPVGWTGKKYQDFIRNGYTQGKNFIVTSEKTLEDLQELSTNKAVVSEIVYNGLTQSFFPKSITEARSEMTQHTGIPLNEGYILHIGGNQWYKNRVGCIKIYDAWRKKGGNLPLVLVGEAPSDNLLSAYRESAFKNDIHFITGIKDSLLSTAYSGGAVLLFPSLGEGFGWPIAEAMACGCPVITTGEKPMTEVAGAAAVLLPRMPDNKRELDEWSKQGADCIDSILLRSDKEKEEAIRLGLENVKRFDTENALSRIEKIYYTVVLQMMENKQIIQTA